jgi:hypothetical protein
MSISVLRELDVPARAVHALGDLAYAAPVIEPAVSEGELRRGTPDKYRSERSPQSTGGWR